MNTKLIKIELTDAQVDSAKWLLGCPLFCDYSEAAEIEHAWDETPERAAQILAAAKRCNVDGSTLTLDPDRDVLQYVHEYAEKLADMSAKEYMDTLLAKGIPHRDAQCKVNSAVRSAAALADKIGAYL